MALKILAGIDAISDDLNDKGDWDLEDLNVGPDLLSYSNVLRLLLFPPKGKPLYLCVNGGASFQAASSSYLSAGAFGYYYFSRSMCGCP